MKIIGMPGEVMTRAAPSVERFWAKKLSACPGGDKLGNARLSGLRRHLVMRFGVDDPVKGVVVESLRDDITKCNHIARPVIGGDKRTTQLMHEAGPPLRSEAGAAVVHGPGQPSVVLHVFGNRDLPWLAIADLGVDPLHQAPAVWN